MDVASDVLQKFSREELDQLFDALSRLGIFFKDLDKDEVIPNAFWAVWGYSAEEMKGERWLKALHPDDRAQVRMRFEEHGNGSDEITQSEYRVLTKSGEVRWILSKAILFGGEGDNAHHKMVAIDYDVTAMKEAEEQIARARADAEAHAREAELLRRAGAAIASTLDRSQAVRRVLSFLAQTVPYQTATVQVLEEDVLEVVDSSGPVRSGFGPGTKHALRDHFGYRWIVESREPELLVRPADEIPELPEHADGEPISWIGVPLLAQGVVVGTLTLSASHGESFGEEHLRLASAIADYVALAIQNARLFEVAHRAAITDPLTGVYTRYWFIPYVEQEIAAALRASAPLSLLVFDLDHFKQLNDTYGHPAGDDVLAGLIRAISGVLRAANPVCRLGGEEFAVLLPGTEAEAARAVAGRLCETAEAARYDCCPYRPVTISVGVASLGDSCRDYRELLSNADKALYRAKARGRNRVVLSGAHD
ncbi:MAG: diguanylate cyclase [Spirochaetes bacterium]|nr:diguanylate cyclase [Spirochaetota bacterium]